MNSSTWSTVLNESIAREWARDWQLTSARGVLAILFGVIFLFAPVFSLVVSVYVFAGFVIALGVLALVAGIRNGDGTRWPLIIEGVLGLLVGILALVSPGITLLTFAFFIAAWAIVTGVLQIYEAIKLRDEIDNEWWLVLGGAASVIFGVLVAAWPGAGLQTIALLIGIYAIVFGVMLVMLGFRLKSFGERVSTAVARAAA